MSKKAKHQEHEEELGEGWLLPYADLLTLLLALFIVLFLTSKMDESKFAAMAAAFTNAIMGGAAFQGVGDYTDLNVLPQLEIDVTDPTDNPSQETQGGEAGEGKDNQTELEEIQRQLAALFAEEGLEGKIAMKTDERGLIISLSDAVLFDSGQAVIKNEYKDMLISICQTINRLQNYIRVEGHTDTVPINTGVYPNNWYLSGARASAVVTLFETEGGADPDKLMALGLGERRPVDDNSTIEGRAKNRRVDIVILNTKYNAVEDAGHEQTATAG